ncbi:MAG: amino acid ABC transporter substrate-binding protein, partial [Bdellovibrionaceae bacterium]|nr:amino acid ABC transporter substrate-binding protein [Pseudobdellovibrionaceae bacterium]
MFKFSILLFFVATIVQAEPLRWAADTESGAPYVFYDVKSLAMTGYEYDLVQAIAKKINREPTFVQNAWDGLILGLNNNLYDIALNGIEITEDRKKSVYFSEPYYATYMNIITKQGDTRFKKLSDLPGFKIGTLGGALSERILRAEEGVYVVVYESEALAHQDLLLGRTDAIFLDAPIAKYYSEVDKRFQVVPTAIGSMTYGIAISKKNPELLKSVNKALSELVDSGELKSIYEKWGLWNSATASLFGDTTAIRFKPTEYEKFKSHLN